MVDDITEEGFEKAHERQTSSMVQLRIDDERRTTTSSSSRLIWACGRHCPRLHHLVNERRVWLWSKELRVCIHDLLTSQHLFHISLQAPDDCF